VIAATFGRAGEGWRAGPRHRDCAAV